MALARLVSALDGLGTASICGEVGLVPPRGGCAFRGPTVRRRLHAVVHRRLVWKATSVPRVSLAIRLPIIHAVARSESPSLLVLCHWFWTCRSSPKRRQFRTVRSTSFFGRGGILRMHLVGVAGPRYRRASTTVRSDPCVGCALPVSSSASPFAHPLVFLLVLVPSLHALYVRPSGWKERVDTSTAPDRFGVAMNPVHVASETRVHPTCPICLHVHVDAVEVQGCAHRFCMECIQTWANQQKRPRCPVCNERVEVVLDESGSEVVLEGGEEHDVQEADLSGLDHAYFHVEAKRVLSRAEEVQQRLVHEICNGGRGGRPNHHANRPAALEQIQPVVESAQRCVQSMRMGIPFDPNQVLAELYDLQAILEAIEQQDYASPITNTIGPRRYSAADAEWMEEDASDSCHSQEDEDPSWYDHVQSKHGYR